MLSPGQYLSVSPDPRASRSTVANVIARIRRISHVAIGTGTATAAQESGLIDHRFIDYLHAQPEDLSRMHWRQSEYLAGEFFRRNGYHVEVTARVVLFVGTGIWPQFRDTACPARAGGCVAP
jgi:hypothetical protein